MKPRDNMAFVIAMLTVVPAVGWTAKLYNSGDLGAYYQGLVWILVCLWSLYQAYRKPKSNTDNQIG